MSVSLILHCIITTLQSSLIIPIWALIFLKIPRLKLLRQYCSLHRPHIFRASYRSNLGAGELEILAHPRRGLGIANIDTAAVVPDMDRFEPEK